jgi:hypothetical protein
MTGQWRYRTQVLAGPWRPTVGQAAEDAIAQGQALRDETEPHGLSWRVPGAIEGNADGGAMQLQPAPHEIRNLNREFGEEK